MPFCSNCGVQITGTENFCPSCGTSLKTAGKTVPMPEPAIPGEAQYRVILADKGGCTKALTKDVLRDLMGYTLADAGALIDAMPVVVAQNLTRSQAMMVSEVLTDYGMNASVCDRRNAYVNFGPSELKPVFSSRGTMLAGASAILRTLTKENQVDRIIRWSQPNLLDFLFRPPVRRETPLQFALGSLFDLIHPNEPPRGDVRRKTSSSPRTTGTGRKTTSGRAPERAKSTGGSKDDKPPVPRPPVRAPGVGSGAGGRTTTSQRKTTTGPGTGRRTK